MVSEKPRIPSNNEYFCEMNMSNCRGWPQDSIDSQNQQSTISFVATPMTSTSSCIPDGSRFAACRNHLCHIRCRKRIVDLQNAHCNHSRVARICMNTTSPSYTNPVAASTSSAKPAKIRNKCRLCGDIGHNARTCPHPSNTNPEYISKSYPKLRGTLDENPCVEEAPNGHVGNFLTVVVNRVNRCSLCRELLHNASTCPRRAEIMAVPDAQSGPFRGRGRPKKEPTLSSADAEIVTVPQKRGVTGRKNRCSICRGYEHNALNCPRRSEVLVSNLAVNTHSTYLNSESSKLEPLSSQRKPSCTICMDDHVVLCPECAGTGRTRRLTMDDISSTALATINQPELVAEVERLREKERKLWEVQERAKAWLKETKGLIIDSEDFKKDSFFLSSTGEVVPPPKLTPSECPPKTALEESLPLKAKKTTTKCKHCGGCGWIVCSCCSSILCSS